MGAIVVNPKLNVFERYKKVNIINPYRYSGEDPVMTFQTDRSGTFSPSFTIDVGVLQWDYGDGSPLEITNSPSHLYADSSVKTVKVYANTVTVGSVISAVDFNSQNIIGTLDFSWHTINGTYMFNANSGLTGLVFTTSGNTSTNFQSVNTNITGILDVSSINLSGTFRVDGNSNLTSITHGITNGSVSNYQFDGCDITGTLDLSTITLTSILNGQNNTNLTAITFNTTVQTLNSCILYNCGLTTIDFSNITIQSNVQLYDNSLTSITWSSIGQIVIGRFDGNALTEVEVDEILNLIQVYSTSIAPTADLTLNLSGGTNSAPSATGLTDKSTIETNYTNAGKTATITVNP